MIPFAEGTNPKVLPDDRRSIVPDKQTFGNTLPRFGCFSTFVLPTCRDQTTGRRTQIVVPEYRAQPNLKTATGQGLEPVPPAEDR